MSYTGASACPTSQGQPLTGQSTTTTTTPGSLQAVDDSVSVSAPPRRHEDGHHCTCPVPGCHYALGNDGRATNDPFELDPRELRAQRHMAAFTSASNHTVHVTSVPPPETTGSEEMTSSLHAAVEWPYHQEDAWADRLLRGTSITTG